MEQVHLRIYTLVLNICGPELGSLLCQNYSIDDLVLFLTTYRTNMTKQWLSKMEVDEIFMQNDSDDLENLNLTLTEHDIVDSGTHNDIGTCNISSAFDEFIKANDTINIVSRNTKKRMYKCLRCAKTYCNTDGVRKHWRKNHNEVFVRRGYIEDYCITVNN